LRAAERLHVDQSPLSRTVKELGTLLFVRATRSRQHAADGPRTPITSASLKVARHARLRNKLSVGYFPFSKRPPNTAALSTLYADKPEEDIITVRQSKYLNNLIEQDHRNIKRRIRPMLGFTSFRRSQTLLAGIELVQMIRKGQLQHPAGDRLSPAEQFYLMAA